ncbi:DUF789 domain-containing protein [Sutcliffiella rhizosphaerae]|uniref:SCP2 domain-containing protein n=1 Tax=Sutcliffiella rhizosphaerae TaxID=2880967 RepID=A0ABN8A852_9BACI|nr:DUF789 domain-containing protein [Sutcliffiella rhizosphaerae]CAG9620824.1 hypothetical protein BACCIP111883_01595 [Sutcliffiella rhizosphaerae]
MVKENLERFLARVKLKPHVLEILPAYSLRCCLVVEEERYNFTLTKEKLQMESQLDEIDVVIEGPEEEIVSMLSGTKIKDLKNVHFTGTFRHYLFMDSLLTLVNSPIGKEAG